MKTALLCAAAAALLALAGLHALAQEMVPAPEPIAGAKVDANVPAPAGPAADATIGPTKSDWRYRWYNGRWWYWMPQNRWMWYADNRHWVAFDANNPPPAVRTHGYPHSYGGYHYYYPGPGYYYPGPGYSAGYYPGVGVGVGPYGSVGVGVGRRVSVDVRGPHGGVRVGRIFVGW
jgi:hypothetical protein